jgi:hypothetical protein
MPKTQSSQSSGALPKNHVSSKDGQEAGMVHKAAPAKPALKLGRASQNTNTNK